MCLIELLLLFIDVFLLLLIYIWVWLFFFYWLLRFFFYFKWKKILSFLLLLLSYYIGLKCTIFVFLKNQFLFQFYCILLLLKHPKIISFNEFIKIEVFAISILLAFQLFFEFFSNFSYFKLILIRNGKY